MLPKALHFNRKFKGTEAPLLVDSPLEILVGLTFLVCPTTEWRKQKLWAVAGWRGRFWIRGCLYRTKASLSPPVFLHQSRRQEELQFKCSNLGKGMGRILSTFSLICCKGELKRPSGGGVSQTHIFPASHIPGLGKDIPQSWEREASILPPGPMRPTCRGLAHPVKDYARSLTPETGNVVCSFSG